jgi:ABC-type sugar transport system substrate-binding protein
MTERIVGSMGFNIWVNRNTLRIAALLALALILGGCGKTDINKEYSVKEETEAENVRSGEAKTPAIGLILTSEDDEENEAVIAGFQEAAGAAGAELMVRIPDVTCEEAQEAVKLEGSFVLCDVNPIEYQMLLINDLVMENVDVIAIHSNHREALEPVLSAARAVGIRVCAFGCDVGEKSCDIFADTEEAPQKTVDLLREAESYY